MSIRPTLAVCGVVSIAACPGTSTGPAMIAPTAVFAPAVVTAVVPRAPGDLVPPRTLTASDGNGLVLARVDARSVASGPLALTELHFDFRNDEDRVREGTFQITLPAHSAVSRFVMRNVGQWLEADVVSRLVARRAYDDFLHRRQDPALLEQAPGNQFTVNVFPIAPRSDKHLVISYCQELPGLQYVLPLRGLPRVECVDVELSFTGDDGARRSQRLAERDWQPDRDFVADSPVTAAAVGAESLVGAQIELASAAGGDPPRGVAFLVDTSASRALGFERCVASVRKLVGELRHAWRDALPLAVVAFDQDAELVFDGLAGPAASVEVSAGGAPSRIRVVPAAAPLVERAVAGAELAELSARLAAALRAAIAQKSVVNGVLSSETSMLVLESDADYARSGIERTALADVLVVGTDGVERMHCRGAAPIPLRAAPSKPPPPNDGEPGLATPSRRHAPPPPRPQAPAAGDLADHDSDDIPDAENRCPNEPQTHNGLEDDDGCPDRGRVVVTSTAIEILDNVYFEPDREAIQRASLPILDAVTATLLRNSWCYW